MQEERHFKGELIGWMPAHREKSEHRPTVTSVWGYGDFEVRVEVVVDVSGTAFTHLEVDASSITARTLADIRLGDLRKAIAKGLRDNPELLDRDALMASHHDDPKIPVKVKATEERLEEMRQRRVEVEALADEVKDHPPTKGAPPGDPDFYPKIAYMYEEALDEHTARGAVKAMAEDLETKQSTVSGWIFKARKKGWLGEAPGQGVAGGEATDKLKQWKKEKGL